MRQSISVIKYLENLGFFLFAFFTIIIIITISLTSIFFQDQSRVWTAASQQHYIDNQPLSTFWDLSCSHSDASISRKSHPVTILKAAVYPWESWSEFMVAGCPSSHQPTRIREETLESGGPLQRKLNFGLHTHIRTK